MKKKYGILIVAAIAVLTAVFAVIHLTHREAPAQGSVLVKADGKTCTVSEKDLTLVPVEGTTVNGKGEEKQISAEGVALREVLKQAGVRAVAQVTVYADDEYSAVVSADELAEAGRVWLLHTGEGFRLIVFGDENSKRDVKHVARIEVQ